MSSNHLLLAGGGHAHALVLLKWAMHPKRKPKGLITLVSRDSTNIYSGMFPGVISGKYQFNETFINLRQLADSAGVTFVKGEITNLDLKNNHVSLLDRSSINYTHLSLNIGSGTCIDYRLEDLLKGVNYVSIKPFNKCFSWIKSQESDPNQFSKPFYIIGSGLAAIEIALALRKRWPSRIIFLKAHPNKLKNFYKQALVQSRIKLTFSNDLISGPALLCTGIQIPKWLIKAGFCVTKKGRILTDKTFQAKGFKNVFAVGDCAVIEGNYKPPSGVWPVRSANPLALNLERNLEGLRARDYKYQRFSLELVGIPTLDNSPKAWLLWGPFSIGPNSLFWHFKNNIDQAFMEKFRNLKSMKVDISKSEFQCRGCAAKISSLTLKNALEKANFFELAHYPEDAALIDGNESNEMLIQSIDGFPALISDPWLNGRLTALHACSDIWARGCCVISAQALVILPRIRPSLQEELLINCLNGMKSVFEQQSAKLIGGHTYESRNEFSESPSLGIDISIVVNGKPNDKKNIWSKSGLQEGDDLLISRPLGTGVIFAGNMRGITLANDLDNVLDQISKSQHILLHNLNKQSLGSKSSRIVHASTDITGFGLLGHLGEMINSTNAFRAKHFLKPLRVNIDVRGLPFYPGAKSLFLQGCESSLAKANRRFLSLLLPQNGKSPLVNLIFSDREKTFKEDLLVKELLIDPQTCGPLLIGCSPNDTSVLIDQGPWMKIGSITTSSSI